MTRTEYHRHYWQDYRRRKHRVSIMLSPAEARALKARAGGLRKPGEQLWLEAQSYREDRYLPAAVVAERIDGLFAMMTQVYDLLTAAGQGPLGQALVLPEVVGRLHQLRDRLDRFLSPTGR